MAGTEAKVEAPMSVPMNFLINVEEMGVVRL